MDTSREDARARTVVRSLILGGANFNTAAVVTPAAGAVGDGATRQKLEGPGPALDLTCVFTTILPLRNRAFWNSARNFRIF